MSLGYKGNSKNQRNSLHLEELKVGKIALDKLVCCVHRQKDGASGVLVGDCLVKIKDHNLNFRDPVAVDEFAAIRCRAERERDPIKSSQQ